MLWESLWGDIPAMPQPWVPSRGPAKQSTWDTEAGKNIQRLFKRLQEFQSFTIFMTWVDIASGWINGLLIGGVPTVTRPLGGAHLQNARALVRVWNRF